MILDDNIKQLVRVRFYNLPHKISQSSFMIFSYMWALGAYDVINGVPFITVFMQMILSDRCTICLLTLERKWVSVSMLFDIKPNWFQNM